MFFNLGMDEERDEDGEVETSVFTVEQMGKLEATPNVQHVSETAITYTPAFKLAAVKAYAEDQTPSEIFIRAALTWMPSYLGFKQSSLASVFQRCDAFGILEYSRKMLHIFESNLITDFVHLQIGVYQQLLRLVQP
ncbi:hypothetical protein QFZ80_001421 [Paenibacillus sp. V4I7]|nr:hypothetical protein [Paenibacillus sp. V4I7]